MPMIRSCLIRKLISSTETASNTMQPFGPTKGAASHPMPEQRALNDLVKERLKDDPEVYAQFLEAMNAFNEGRYDHTSFQASAASVLNGYPDLVAIVREADLESPLPLAVDYVVLLKRKLENQPQAYNEVLGLLTDFDHQKIDLPTFVERAQNLFNGDQELIKGLEQFLPDGQILA